MQLTFRSEIDPKTLAVNKRFKGSHVLTKEVREAMKSLCAEAEGHMVSQNPGWRQRSTDYYIVAIDFFMTDFRNDADGPLKRTIDAIFAGAGITDSRVQEIYVRRFLASRPGIEVSITQCRKGDYDVRDYRAANRGPDAVPESPDSPGYPGDDPDDY